MKRRNFLVLLLLTPIAVPLLRRSPNGRKTLSAQTQQRTLPAWFDHARVQAHSRLTRRWFGKPEFTRFPEAAAALGATVLSRHVKSGDETPAWTRLLPRSGGASDPSQIREMVEQAHTHGVRMIAYYWHMAERGYAETHPEWVCRTRGQEAAEHAVRGAFLDITGEYREAVLARLLELAELGVDGFNFDHMHVPVSGCRGTQLERDFTRETGMRIPERARRNDPALHAFHGYTARRVAETFRYWRERVNARYPGKVFVVSTTYLPGLTSNRMSLDLARAADACKTEYYLALLPARNERVFQGQDALLAPRPEHRMALGWSLLRDSAAGRPPRVWAPGFPDAENARAFVSAVTTFGAIASVDIDEESILDRSGEAGRRHAINVAAFELGKPISRYMGGTRPLRYAAVLMSERARDARGMDYRRAWREVIWPSVGAFGCLLDAGVPTGTIDDVQLAAGAFDGIRILFIADEKSLTEPQRAALNVFRSGGGRVIAQQAGWRWASEPDTAAARFKSSLAAALNDAPVRITARSGQPYGGAFRTTDGQRIVVPISNAFAWLNLSKSTEELDIVEATRNPEMRAQRKPTALQGVEVRFQDGRTPRRAFEAVSNASLPLERIDNAIRVRLDRVEQYALVVFEF